MANSVEVDKLKKDIAIKFYTVKTFCSLAKLPYKDVINTLNLKHNDSDLYQRMVSSYMNITPNRIPGIIQDRHREEIRVCIITRYRSLSSFAKYHRGYDTLWLSNIINGKLKLESTKYRKFVIMMNRDYYMDIDLSDDDIL